jgi:hypothetical protein
MLDAEDITCRIAVNSWDLLTCVAITHTVMWQTLEEKYTIPYCQQDPFESVKNFIIGTVIYIEYKRKETHIKCPGSLVYNLRTSSGVVMQVICIHTAVCKALKLLLVVTSIDKAMKQKILIC